MNGEYISTFEDFKAAQKLHLKHNRAARVRFWTWMIGAPVFTLLCAIGMLHESYAARSDGFGLAAWLTFCGFVMTISVVVLRPWNLRRCFRRMRIRSGLAEQIRVRITFDEESVTSAIPERSEGRFLWTALRGFVENSHLTLLYISPKQFLFIPKRAMDDQSWDAMRAAARGKGLEPHAY